MLRRQIEAGKLWVEDTVRDTARRQQVTIDSLQWIFCPSPLAYRFYLVVTSGDRAVGGEFNYAILEDCRRSRGVQEMLRSGLSRLLCKLVPEPSGDAEHAVLAAAQH